MSSGPSIPRYEAKDFLKENLKECDLVMQGGIASGVVYPPAVLRIAKDYHIRCVGGASAGAIAAAATAAAEYGRADGGYMELQNLTDELQKPSFVLNLFQPSTKTRPLLNALLAIIQKKDPANTTKKKPDTSQQSRARSPLTTAFSKVSGALWLTEILLRHNPAAFMSGAVGGAALPTVFSQLVGGSLDGPRMLLPFVSGWLGGVLSSAGYLAWVLLHGVADKDTHLFGICTGSTHAGAENSSHPVLTDWLHTWINRLAKLSDERPLTFGDLRKKNITFKLVTTNLSQGQPYMLPLEKGGFIFKREDMQKLFPEPVVKYMSNAVPNSSVQLPEGYHYMPTGDKMPIIVATRLSLSFPILLSAVRLYTVKSDAFKRGQINKEDLQEHWFSDGGITSNFPIHIFDAWMPTCPTFGIKLTGMPDDCTPQDDENEAYADIQQAKYERIFLPKPSQHVPPDWIQINGLTGFFANMFDTARNYRDNLQATLPSYRERIVQVRLEANEGGLNLHMPPDVINKMLEKGHQAGEALVKFGLEGFSQHQWVRMRVLLAQFEKEIVRMRRDFFKALPTPQDASTLEQLTRYQQLLAQYQGLMALQVKLKDSNERWYRPQDQIWCDEATQRIKALLALIEQWDQSQTEWEKNNPAYKDKFFPHKGPLPEPLLRVTPGV